MILLGLSLVPSDVAYSQVERALSMVEPVGSASQQLRTIPSTASSIILEAFQSRALDVEGVEINLDYAVNPTERVEERRFYSEVLGEDRTYRVYLPPGYEDAGSAMKGYPVLYLLHGMSQGHQWWTEVARVDRIATAMIEAGKGAIIVTGNTSAWRGKPRFSMFAPTKAAQRILAQAMARDLGPQGVHVAYVTVDAAIDTPWTRPRLYPDNPDDFFTDPDAIAEEIFHVAHQDRSAWSFDVELRPFNEDW